jgi:hypothetical protein
VFADKRILPCYDAQIMSEFKVVLSRPKLAFNRAKVGIFISSMHANGLPVSVQPSAIEFVDETEKSSTMPPKNALQF